MSEPQQDTPQEAVENTQQEDTTVVAVEQTGTDAPKCDEPDCSSCPKADCSCCPEVDCSCCPEVTCPEPDCSCCPTCPTCPACPEPDCSCCPTCPACPVMKCADVPNCILVFTGLNLMMLGIANAVFGGLKGESEVITFLLVSGVLCAVSGFLMIFYNNRSSDSAALGISVSLALIGGAIFIQLMWMTIEVCKNGSGYFLKTFAPDFDRTDSWTMYDTLSCHIWLYTPLFLAIYFTLAGFAVMNKKYEPCKTPGCPACSESCNACSESCAKNCPGCVEGCGPSCATNCPGCYESCNANCPGCADCCFGKCCVVAPCPSLCGSCKPCGECPKLTKEDFQIRPFRIEVKKVYYDEEQDEENPPVVAEDATNTAAEKTA